jgi:hypothetical protein
MVKLLKLITLRNLILVAVAWWVWKNFVSEWLDIHYSLPILGAGTIENYGDPHLHYSCWNGHGFGNCDGYGATKECHQYALNACGGATDQLKKCWMPAFLKCTASAGATNTPLSQANCHAYATAFCGGDVSSADGCQGCYADAHQQCMASKGMGAGACA